MGRSIKKGPFVDFSLMDKIQKAKAANQKTLEIHETKFLLVTAADAASRGATVMVASAGFLANLDQALLGLVLRNITEVRI